MTTRNQTVDWSSYQAVLFDLDGVLTATMTIHAICWKRMFDDFLKRRAARKQESFEPFDTNRDYREYVDGKLRYDGVRSFLASREIILPEGTPEDHPEEETVCGLGNRKDQMVGEILAAQSVEVFEGSVALARWLRDRKTKIAVVSASRNCETVLRTAGISELFDLRVDGIVAEQFALPGKPAPDTFLKAAELLSVRPELTVVIEDAISGVRAGRAGGFGLVVAVEPQGDFQALYEHGADLVVKDLAELIPQQ